MERSLPSLPSRQWQTGHSTTLRRLFAKIRVPGPAEIQLMDNAGRIAGIAIERDRSQTALIRAFEQIDKSEAQLRHIVDAIPQMIGVLNPDGTFLYMNQTMLDYTGLTIKEVMATDVRDRIHGRFHVAGGTRSFLAPESRGHQVVGIVPPSTM